MKKLLLSLIFSCCFGNGVVQAGFLMSVNPADLIFNGPGVHNVRFFAQHNGIGASTFSGYTVRFGSVADASSGILPAGVVATSATEVLAVSSNGLFNLNPTTNTIAASSLAGDQNIGSGGTATLFSLALNMGSASSYQIGVDFQNAQRGGLFSSDISDEFFNPNSPTTDFSFTLTAVPEPSSLALMACGVGFAALNRRRQRVLR